MLLHENRHHFVSKEHSLTGQAEAGFRAPQAAGFEKRLEVTTKPAPDSVSRSACHPRWLIMTGLPAASASKNLFAELFHNCGKSMTKDTATVVRARSAGMARFGRGGIIHRL